MEVEDNDGEAVVVRQTEHGYDVVLYNEIPYPPFMQPRAIDGLRARAWFRESDIVIATYPKCGTTWMQNIILCLLAGGDASRVRDPMKMSKWVEASCSYKQGDAPVHAGQGGKFTVDQWAEWHQPEEEQVCAPTRRVIKTHAPAHLCPWAGGGAPQGIPKGSKVIVVARNPKDTAVSLFHHARDVQAFNYTGEWEHFLSHLFLPGKVEHGDFWSWYAGWHKARQVAPEEIMWVTYEQLKADLPAVIARVAEFCNIRATPEALSGTVAASTFEAMKCTAAETDAHKAARGEWVKRNHIRVGVAGGWRKQFSEEQNAAFDLHHASRSQAESLPPDLFDFGGSFT